MRNEPMMRARNYDIKADETFVTMMRLIARGASKPMTDVEMLKRWIAMGMAFDAQRPEEQAAHIVNTGLKITSY